MMKRTLTGFMLMCACISMSVLADDQVGDSQPPAASSLPGLAYKGVNIQLGGFLASEMVYRNNNMASDIGTNYSKIPFASGAGNGMAEFRGTERQSRFSLLAQSDVGDRARVAGYYELDFLGTTPTSNANESNSYAPRTRNVYMTIDCEQHGWHLLAGQNWSLATLNSKGITPRNEYIPSTIDAQYAVGFNWERQWQLRLVKDWDKVFWAAVSFENAQTVGLGGANISGTGNTYQLPAGALMSANMSYNSYPDIIAKFAWESRFGHYEAYGLARNFQSRYGGGTLATQTSKQNDWTEAVGAGVTVPVGKIVDISLSGLYGKGIGRYGTVGLPDATFADDGSLAPLSGSQWLLKAAWHASAKWEVYAAYGQESVSSSLGSANDGYGDGIANNAGCSTLGGSPTCAPLLKSVNQANLGFWWSFFKGDFGVGKLGVQYSHTSLNTYADNTGVAPTTSEDMAFTSLRFYPF